MNSTILRHPVCHLTLILLLGFLAYANSFQAPFVLDDLESIVNNRTIHHLGNFLPGGSGYDFVFRRSLVYFTFALNYHFGGLSVFGYHLFNLAVHLGNALLLYLLLRQTFRTPHLSNSPLAEREGTIALLAALFFVIHPVQMQAVTYIVQRLTSLCTFFYLLSLVAYVGARLRQEAVWAGQEALPRDLRVPLLLAASCIAAVLAMFCKEIAFTLPLAALLYEFCFFRGAWQRRILLLAPLLLTLVIIPLNTFAPEEGARESLLAQTYADTPPLHYLFTQFRVIVTYLRLLVLPVNQNLDYDYPLYTSLFAPPVFLSLLLLAAFLLLAIYLYGFRFQKSSQSRVPNPESRLAAFAILWFFLALSVESTFVPLADLIFEHRLYLPSIGPAIALAVVVVMISQKTTALFNGRLPLIAAAIALLVLGVATWQRNQVWQSEVSLWEDTLRKSPHKARPLYNYGTYLGDHGRPAEAVRILTRVVALDPRHADAWHNLGRAQLLLGNTGAALEPLRTAVQLKPELEKALLNYTVALIRLGKYAEAIALLEKAHGRTPDSPGVHLNLGLAHLGSRNLAAARQELVELERLDPRLARFLADSMKQAGTAP